MNRRTFLAMLTALGAPGAVLAQGKAQQATLYKNPLCGCCQDHAEYLRQHGYDVREIATHDLDGIRRKLRVPEQLYGCHTILVGGYVVEGHVSAPLIDRLLRERPKIRGISLPGMPPGSPGMTGPKLEPFVIYEIGDRVEDQPRIYAVE
ncbi:MAG TPA: DUF411 domain-containing protein [Ramlibacter sp.]|nr:DUF411 domain-containing protein [Ramlibacter sp.]